MFRDPLVLDVWFLLHIGKDWFLWLLCLLWYSPSFISSYLQANEMKAQILSLDTMEGSVSFFNELDIKKELCSRSVLFFNELETKNKHCSRLVSSFNELETKNKHYSRLSVSFLHKLEIENNYACGDLFHFYTSLK